MSLSAILAPGLRFIRARQLPSGEILCHAPLGEDLCYCPYPFWSATVYDALAFADPASPRFDRRLLDLLRPGERCEVPTMVSATRWRIRTYLAAEEEPGCTWRLHGRHSASAVDAATSACAAEAMLLPPSLDSRVPRNRHTGPLLRRLGDDAIDPTGRCYVLGYLSCAGTSTIDVPSALIRLFQSDRERSLFFLFAAARALNRCGAAHHDEIAAALLPAPVSNRMCAAMQLSALLDLGYDGPEMPERIESVVSCAANPAAWTWPTYSAGAAGSAGATMALILSALFRASATAGGAMLL